MHPMSLVWSLEVRVAIVPRGLRLILARYGHQVERAVISFRKSAGFKWSGEIIWSLGPRSDLTWVKYILRN